jgi:DNA-binding SARP family transcriptional activator
VSAAIDTVQQVVASDPLHEEAQGLLMRLLVQTGRRHRALWQYRVLRAALQRELHVEPAASLQALYHDIRDILNGHAAQDSCTTLIRVEKEPT